MLRKKSKQTKLTSKWTYMLIRTSSRKMRSVRKILKSICKLMIRIRKMRIRRSQQTSRRLLMSLTQIPRFSSTNKFMNTLGKTLIQRIKHNLNSYMEVRKSLMLPTWLQLLIRPQPIPPKLSKSPKMFHQMRPLPKILQISQKWTRQMLLSSKRKLMFLLMLRPMWVNHQWLRLKPIKPWIRHRLAQAKPMPPSRQKSGCSQRQLRPPTIKPSQTKRLTRTSKLFIVIFLLQSRKNSNKKKRRNPPPPPRARTKRTSFHRQPWIQRLWGLMMRLRRRIRKRRLR